MSNLGPLPSHLAAGRKGPSCWAIGGLSCLGLFVMSSVVITFLALKAIHTPHGKVFYKELVTVWNHSKLIPQCSEQMADIRGALVRYHIKDQKYPARLIDLYPNFLPNKSDLHSALDLNKDPNHLSFTYTRPAPTTPSTATILTIKWTYVDQEGKDVSHTDEVLSETLGGTMTQTQYLDGKMVGQTSFDNSSQGD